MWPPLQERSSFAKRFSRVAAKNEQSWEYLPASAVWDLESTARLVKERFNIDIIEHSPECTLPDMLDPDNAFQQCPTPPGFDGEIKYLESVYLQRHDPEDLAARVRYTAQAASSQFVGGNLIIDLPCTLFMLDVRRMPEMEELAKSVRWSRHISGLADKVVAGIRGSTGLQTFNGIHLRMEKDAQDWAKLMGGQRKYWMRYKVAMRRAGFDKTPRQPLYVASGLLKSVTTSDNSSKVVMDDLLSDSRLDQFASSIEFKEKYLHSDDLELSNEQSALVDFLVLQASHKAVGIGVSTFSFYLSEARLVNGLDPVSTVLVMMPYIGTDELFYTSALVAIESRARLHALHKLKDVCRRMDMEKCFSDLPVRPRSQVDPDAYR